MMINLVSALKGFLLIAGAWIIFAGAWMIIAGAYDALGFIRRRLKS